MVPMDGLDGPLRTDGFWGAVLEKIRG